MSDSMNVAKFTLSSGKVVYLREPKIGDTEHAAKVAGKLAGAENQAYLGVLLQKEMVKLLLVKVDDKELSISEKQMLDKLFTYKEFNQVQQAVRMMTDDEQGNSEKLIPEFVGIGKE